MIAELEAEIENISKLCRAGAISKRHATLLKGDLGACLIQLRRPQGIAIGDAEAAKLSSGTLSRQRLGMNFQKAMPKVTAAAKHLDSEINRHRKG